MAAILLASKKDPVEVILEHVDVINQQLDKIKEQAERIIRSGERRGKDKDAGK